MGPQTRDGRCGFSKEFVASAYISIFMRVQLLLPYPDIRTVEKHLDPIIMAFCRLSWGRLCKCFNQSALIALDASRSQRWHNLT